MQHLDHASTRGHRLRRPHLRSTRRRLEPALVALTTVLLTGLIGVGSAIGASEIESVIPETGAQGGAALVPRIPRSTSPTRRTSRPVRAHRRRPSSRSHSRSSRASPHRPANGVQYRTWGYRLPGDDQVISGTPGPIIRARVGDVLRFTLTNPATNSMPHNVDFHAVTGQGGGAADTTVAPGETATIEARLLYPGSSCTTAPPATCRCTSPRACTAASSSTRPTPLPPVDHELYMVQSEFYTVRATDAGPVDTDRAAITDEQPTFVVFNGAGAPSPATTPRTCRSASACASTSSTPASTSTRTSTPSARTGTRSSRRRRCSTRHCAVRRRRSCRPAAARSSSSIGRCPATIVLVDHALSRAFDKGAIGQIVVEGESDPEIFEATQAAG